MTDQRGLFHRSHSPSDSNPTLDLRTIRLFEDLPDKIVKLVATQGQIRRVNHGEVLFIEGQEAASVHFLLAGQVKIVHETDDGQEIILRLIQSGEIFGGAGGWGVGKYPATAVTLEKSRVFRIPAAEFTLLISRQPEFALAVIRELGTRLREAEARIHELQVERVERRIARTLLRLANKTGRKTNDGIQIDLPQSRQHLAELTGATMSTVSRVLSEWDRQGLILAGRERVIIAKPHDLVMIAEDFAETGVD